MRPSPCRRSGRASRGRAASARLPRGALSADAAARFAALALKCLHQEYPNHISHTLNSAADARAPHELTPAFYGCLDWHSDVHGHWLLVRLIRLFPDAPFATEARTELVAQLHARRTSPARSRICAARAAPLSSAPTGSPGCCSSRRSCAAGTTATRASGLPRSRRSRREAVARLESWLPKLHYPIRIGEHDQTAFSFGLMWDWAVLSGDAHMRALLSDAAQRFYLHDRNCPLAYEPSGEDFLSPCLAEADFMRRVLAPPAFAQLVVGVSAADSALAQRQLAAASARWLTPGVVTDRADPKLAHIDGLNLSRAWMLEGIAHGLPRARSPHCGAARRCGRACRMRRCPP